MVAVTASRSSLRLASRVDSGPCEYTFETASGVVSPDAFRQPELLLAERLWEDSLGRLLCPQANYGVVATLLASRADGVAATESSARAARLCRHNVAANGAASTVDVELTIDPGAVGERFDTVAYAPKPYTPLEIGSHYLVRSLSAVRPGGSCVLAAAKHTGLGRYRDLLERCCDSVERVATEGGWHLVRAIRSDSDISSSFLPERTLEETVAGVDLELVTLPGVFATSGLDDGTRLLIETVAPVLPATGYVLDLCCGYGPIGSYVAAATDCNVWLSDDSRLATECARGSLDATGVSGTVVTADCLRGVAGTTFDAVVCNPPTHAGTDVLSRLFDGAAAVLARSGTAWFVHHRSLDLRPLLDAFDSVERIETGREHVVLAAAEPSGRHSVR